MISISKKNNSNILIECIDKKNKLLCHKGLKRVSTILVTKKLNQEFCLIVYYWVSSFKNCL